MRLASAFDWRSEIAHQARVAGWTAMVYLAVATAAAALPMITLDASHFHPFVREKYAANLPVVIVHGITAVSALILGLVGLVPWVRRKWLAVHRFAGRAYMLCVLAAGITGFQMGLLAYGGPVAQAGLSSLAVAWIATAAMALREVRARRIDSHRRWMVRNYALTFGAVLLRVYLNVGARFDLDYDAMYPVAAWLCWVPTVAAVEAWMRASRGSRSWAPIRKAVA